MVLILAPRRRLVPVVALFTFVFVLLFLRRSDGYDYGAHVPPSSSSSSSSSFFSFLGGSAPSPQPFPPTSERVPFRNSSFDWTDVDQHFPIHSMIPLPTGRPRRRIPRIQHDFSPSFFRTTTTVTTTETELEARRAAVRDVFVQGWKTYRDRAWGQDEVGPVSGEPKKNTYGGWAVTLFDSLDTLWIMGLKDEFYDAATYAAQVDWAAEKTRAEGGGGFNVLDTTVRHLAGLLSAFDLSGELALLRKATELGDLLYMAFDTPNRLPARWANLNNMRAGTQMAGDHDPSAATGTLALEFAHLSQLTGDPRYFDAVARVTRVLQRTQHQSLLPGMWPRLVDFRNERVDTDNAFTLGATAGSLYEYLPKMHALLGGRDPIYEAMYRRAAETAARHIVFRPMLPSDAAHQREEEEQERGEQTPIQPSRPRILFTGDVYVHDERIDHIPETQQAACFAGGFFALGGRLFDLDHHLDMGDQLARGCAWAYDAFPAGVMPEVSTLIPCSRSSEGNEQATDTASADIRSKKSRGDEKKIGRDHRKALEDGSGSGSGVHLDECPWDPDRWAGEGDPRLRKGFKNVKDPRYLLRPEAIESVFLLYRMTGKEDLRDIAWRMFQATVNATQTPHGNAAIDDVTAHQGGTNKIDSMESHWFAQTLKYYYLIFSPPDLISLDDFVLNTEGHPFRLGI
ncbi:seven-hairpin glycosidase [Sodiomyces alkalinus F11]|uniref:alpha-1,2-Mannosidase n=1 Tax=Sodiomyces alkalinus (strain CBS 110278 / VKM F-3762 / F11) TaxID=1314773 RepID=A0A3N2PZV1_SODAK|nr:seven-hairpin glycosidase [Sodiomyces alkalinus F11]ROT40027.1 seven-hairpin glycosidase [Sodiomyces alkalinus F11]